MLIEKVENTIRTAFDKGDYITEAFAKDLYSKMINNRFNDKFSNQAATLIGSADTKIFVDQKLGSIISAAVEVDAKTDSRINFGEILKSVDRPLDGIKDTNKIYTIALKAYMRKHLMTSTKQNNPKLIDASSSFFFEQFMSFIKKESGYKDLGETENMIVTVSIVTAFVRIIVGKNMGIAKIAASKVFESKYKNTMHKPIQFYFDEVTLKFDFSDWNSYLKSLSEFLPRNVTTKALYSYYMVSFPAAFEGIESYNRFIGDMYSLLRGDSYNSYGIKKRYERLSLIHI